MSDSARDPAMQAVARLEAAVERLAQALDLHVQAGRQADAQSQADTQAGLSRAHSDPAEADMADADATDMVPRAEVAAIAERLEATIANLRAALLEELRPDLRFGES